jgi:hypothetical protein
LFGEETHIGVYSLSGGSSGSKRRRGEECSRGERETFEVRNQLLYSFKHSMTISVSWVNQLDEEGL